MSKLRSRREFRREGQTVETSSSHFGGEFLGSFSFGVHSFFDVLVLLLDIQCIHLHHRVGNVKWKNNDIIYGIQSTGAAFLVERRYSMQQERYLASFRTIHRHHKALLADAGVPYPTSSVSGNKCNTMRLHS